MHLKPSGKPETFRPRLGLYFSESPPTQFPMLLQLEHDGALDVPAGNAAFTVSDELTMPLDVSLLAIYPHAHYLGKEVLATAALPSGEKRTLIWIKDWNLDWQAVYRYRTPVALPKGTVVTMRWTYDNSAANVRNPNHPPRRVRAGNQSTDEMSHLWIQVLPARQEDRKVLQEALMRQKLTSTRATSTPTSAWAACCSRWAATRRRSTSTAGRSRSSRGTPSAENNVGAAIFSTGDDARAPSPRRRGHFRAALKGRPDYVDALHNLGRRFSRQGYAEGRGVPVHAHPYVDPTMRTRTPTGQRERDDGKARRSREGVSGRAAASTAGRAPALYGLGYCEARLGDLGSATAPSGARARDPARRRERPTPSWAPSTPPAATSTAPSPTFERAVQLDPKSQRARAALEKRPRAAPGPLVSAGSAAYRNKGRKRPVSREHGRKLRVRL
jgi:hypothetical protein